MFTFIGIIVGIAVAYHGFKRGFFDMWGKFFNLLISMYLAIFLRPFITEYISEGGNSWIGITLTILLTGIAIFFILYGISFVAFGQFTIELPKILDISGGAIVGFIGGILLWSLLIFLLSITPLSQSSFAKNIGMVKYSADNKATYICWWGDCVNLFASSSESRRSTEEMMTDIFNSAEVAMGRGGLKPKDIQKSSISDPNEVPVEQLRPIEEELGPPPELDFENI
ncbi:MAG: CvpA family protein [Planctomycetota bacterium]|jgi:hypothetical protein